MFLLLCSPARRGVQLCWTSPVDSWSGGGENRLGLFIWNFQSVCRVWKGIVRMLIQHTFYTKTAINLNSNVFLSQWKKLINFNSFKFSAISVFRLFLFPSHFFSFVLYYLIPVFVSCSLTCCLFFLTRFSHHPIILSVAFTRA